MINLSFNDYLTEVKKLDINSLEYKQLIDVYNDYVLTDSEMFREFELMLDNRK